MICGRYVQHLRERERERLLKQYIIDRVSGSEHLVTRNLIASSMTNTKYTSNIYMIEKSFRIFQIEGLRFSHSKIVSIYKYHG